MDKDLAFHRRTVPGTLDHHILDDAVAGRSSPTGY